MNFSSLPVLPKLTDKQRQIIEKRYLLGDNCESLSNIAIEFGVSHQAISKMEQSAVNNLKNLLS
jgi:DNA-directed RNA polymerase sigma subunit (sigma70/sigma32)